MPKSGGRKGRPQGCSLCSHRLRRLKPLTPTLSPATNSAMPSMLPCCTSQLLGRTAILMLTFGTFTGDLNRLAAWFKQCGVSTVAIESAGVYWISVFETCSSAASPCLMAADAVHSYPSEGSGTSSILWTLILTVMPRKSCTLPNHEPARGTASPGWRAMATGIKS